MIIVICLKKLDRETKRSIKQHYSLLEFKKSQINKSIPELGDADVLLFELDISMIFNVKNNIIYKYLKSQDLTSIKVVWVYESSKYKNLIDNVNVFLRKFPLLKHKNIDDALLIQEEKERDIKSKFEPIEFLSTDDCTLPRLEELQQSLIALIEDYKDEEKKHKSLITSYSEQLSKLHEENKKLEEELQLREEPKFLGTRMQEEKEEEHKKKDIYLKKPNETFKFLIHGRTIQVSSNISGIIYSEAFKTTKDRIILMKKLKQKFC